MCFVILVQCKWPSSQSVSHTKIKFYNHSYRAYKTRKYLAAIDWNFHLGLSTATNKSGDQITSRKYNQRTKQWGIRTIKQRKDYQYIPFLIARILNARIQDIDIITRRVPLNASDPRLLAPTIAAKSPPSSKELLQRKSRFSLPSKTADPVEDNPSESKTADPEEEDNPSRYQNSS